MKSQRVVSDPEILGGQSARMNGHDPYAYLKDVLTRLPTHQAIRVNELLPHRWQPTDI